MDDRVKNLALKLLSVIFIAAVYQVILTIFQISYLPGIQSILLELVKIIKNGSFVNNAGITFTRLSISLISTFLLSSILGIVIGLNKNADNFFNIPILLALTIPGFVWAILTLICFGIGNPAVIIAAILSITPFLTIIISDGVKNLDQKLFEVAKIYDFSLTKTLSIVILPQLYPALFSAFRTGFSLCWKLTVVAEVFGVGNGIGYQINYAYHMYNSKMVFAWILSFTTIMVLIDRIVFEYINKKLSYWKTGNGSMLKYYDKN